MHVIAGFESSMYVEMALEELKEQGIQEEHIVIVRMENQVENRNLFDSIHHSDGLSIFDGTAAFAGAGMTFGVIYGSVIRIGPIAVGLIGLFLGSMIGYLLDRQIGKVKKKQKKQQYIAMLLLIRCHSEEQIKMVVSVFRKFFVVTLGVNR